MLDSHTDWPTSTDKIESRKARWTGFNVGQNIGKCAGQTIYWPHIHFIPRQDGDSKKPGGIRHAHLGVIHKHHY